VTLDGPAHVHTDGSRIVVAKESAWAVDACTESIQVARQSNILGGSGEHQALDNVERTTLGKVIDEKAMAGTLQRRCGRFGCVRTVTRSPLLVCEAGPNSPLHCAVHRVRHDDAGLVFHRQLDHWPGSRPDRRSRSGAARLGLAAYRGPAR